MRAVDSSVLLSSVLPVFVSRVETCIEICPPGSSLLTDLPELLQEILSLISATNRAVDDLCDDQDDEDIHQEVSTIVESMHPYSVANRDRKVVHLGSTIKWMVVQFDPRCCTVQPEDRLEFSIFRGKESETTNIEK